MKKYFPLIICCLGAAGCLKTWAQDIPDTDDRRWQDERLYQQDYTHPAPADIALPGDTPPAERSVHLSEEELLHQPRLLARALGAAVLANNAEDTAYLLALYRRTEARAQDRTLIRWADAVVERSRGRHRHAVVHYRNLLADYPDNHLLRLQLAATLTENQEWEAAEEQFLKLRSADILPPAVHRQIDTQLDAIRNHNRWQLYGTLSHIQDKNINNAPQERDLGGGWQAAESEAAHGINVHLGAERRWNVGKGFFAETRTHINGKYYWDSKHYNEAEARFGLGGGFHNARHRLSLIPYLSKTLYAGGRKGEHDLRSFARSHGISTQWQYLAAPKWQLHTAAEYGRNLYRTRPHLNGHGLFATVSASYLPNPRQYWQFGLEYNRTRTRDADDSFNRRGIRLSWGQEWPLGLSSNVSAHYAQRTYRAPMPVFNRIQNNREHGVSASIWHRKLHFAGITPRLTWQHQRNNSSIPLYTYRKNRLFFELSKRF
ncbi:hypothetical protein L1281_001237 [Neisseria sp. HSC-16F19]|nr:porin family protein [Neisseria sp. HSC-16F19]MCP2040648.1 hypothetical protein [Neisseria sp. HSC-16F19]